MQVFGFLDWNAVDEMGWSADWVYIVQILTRLGIRWAGKMFISSRYVGSCRLYVVCACSPDCRLRSLAGFVLKAVVVPSRFSEDLDVVERGCNG